MIGHPWLELTAPYALGALDPEERREFEAHLAECALCRADVQSFGEVAGLLAYAALPAAPASSLRDRIMRDARRIRPIAGRRSAVPWVVAAAAVVLAAFVGDGYRRERTARVLTAGALASTQDSLAARDSLIATLLSPDVGTASLAATGQAPAARLFWIPSRHRVVMAVYRLPPAPVGRTYQLWAIAKGKPVSLGIFNTAPDGRLRTVRDVPPALTFQATAITEEPAGGSPQPTQQPFLIGRLTGGE